MKRSEVNGEHEVARAFLAGSRGGVDEMGGSDDYEREIVEKERRDERVGSRVDKVV